MKKLLCTFVVLLFGLSVAVSAKAADITGNWTASMASPDGESRQMAFTFKQDGGTVTGSIQVQGNPVEISNGKIDGNDFQFDISMNGMTIHHLCTVNGEEIRMTTKRGGDDQGAGFPPMEITLKREKSK